MLKRFSVITCLLFVSAFVQGGERALREFRGVVTLHLAPAKVMQVNEIIETPEPGRSHIGADGILVDMDNNPEVIANWSIVNIKYYQYDEPKPIPFDLSGKDDLVTVNYHAVDVEVVGDMSRYIE